MVRSAHIFYYRGAHQRGSLERDLEIRVLVQYKILEAGEDLLTPIECPSQIPTKLEDVDKDAVGAGLMREEMAKLCSTEDFFG